MHAATGAGGLVSYRGSALAVGQACWGSDERSGHNGRTFGLPAGAGGLSSRRGLDKFSCVQTVGAGHSIARTSADVAEEHAPTVRFGSSTATVRSGGRSCL